MNHQRATTVEQRLPELRREFTKSLAINPVGDEAAMIQRASWLYSQLVEERQRKRNGSNGIVEDGNVNDVIDDGQTAMVLGSYETVPIDVTVKESIADRWSQQVTVAGYVVDGRLWEYVD